MPVGYGEIFNWLVVALGAALALGTGAALITYRRTGAFPGPQRDDRPGDRRSVRLAVGKCLAGVLLLLVGVARLTAAGAV